MNIPAAIEYAMTQAISQYAETGSGVTIRAWQNITPKQKSEDYLRQYPMIDVRCSPPQTDENQHTQRVECNIICMSNDDDDRDHQTVVRMYTGVQELCDALMEQARTMDRDATELDFVLDIIETETSGTGFGLGGISFGEPLPPYDDGGQNAIGINLIMHYSRSW